MNNPSLLRLWDESWSDGIWIAAWSKAVDGLTPEQAAWQPAPSRHSIWQIVSHVCIWREYTLTKLDGRAGPKREEMTPRNFEAPASVTPAAWAATCARLKKSHDDLRAFIAAAPNGPSESGGPGERPAYHLGHDCYHLGQIMYLRAMQGLGVIE